MATEPTPVWAPDWVVPPGDVLLEVLEERGMTQSELARRLDRPVKTINEIANAKAAITPETAIQLERTLGITARFWNNLETNYREALARQRSENELTKEISWARRFPIKELIRHSKLQAGVSAAETVDGILRFFGVGSRAAWEKRWLQPAASFRSSAAFASSAESVAAWLRWGELEAARIECRSFDARQLRAALPDIRKLTTIVPVSHALDRLRTLCAECGVAVVITPEFPGAPLSGAARWLSSDKALIQLSLRHKRDDQFWFTFFHEVDHLLHPSRRQDFVDVFDASINPTLDEEHANQFARDALVPPSEYEQFVNQGDVSAASVQKFASAIEIAPGIVVGRLQRDGLLMPSQLARLKKPMGFMLPPKPVA